MSQILIIVKNKATILGLPNEAFPPIKRHLTISNPLFEKKIELGLTNWGVPRQLEYFTFENNNTITVPIGSLPEILSILNGLGIEIKSEDIKEGRLDNHMPDYFSKIKFNATLRPYQQEMLDSTKRKTVGVIEAMTGAGKTIFALARILHSQQPTLFLVHTLELANQTIDSFVKFTDLKKEDIGLIGNGKFELRPITVGLHQTLARCNEDRFSWINSHFSQVIGDEIHIIAANTWYDTMSKLVAKYKFGISATPQRADGLTKVIHWATGPKIHVVDKKHLKNLLITPTVDYINTEYFFPLFSTQEYQEMITDLSSNPDRNDFILDYANENYPDKYIVMLAERLCQVDYLHDRLPDSVKLTSKMTKKKREQTMDLVKSGKKRIVISTYGLFSTGIDIPALEVLFLCSPIKSEVRLRQSAGRLMRPHPGKTEAKIIDFVDENIGILQNAARKRSSIFRKL